MRLIHLSNLTNRDASVEVASLPAPKAPKLGIPGSDIQFRRFLATGDEGRHERLQQRFGEDYAQALIDGDPEVDLERAGRHLGDTDRVYLASDGEILHSTGKMVEIIFAPDGSEKSRKDPVDTPANVAEEIPIRWTKGRFKKRDAVRRFAFQRVMQIRHVDGLTYDFLYAMAKELHEADELALLGAGADGRQPLIFSMNATAYRAFLEGRIDGSKYQLLLHLSQLELKRPAPAAEV